MLMKKIHAGAFVGAFAFLSIVGVQGVSADTLIGTYDGASSPAISGAGETVTNSSGTIAYMLMSGGVAAVDTNGTATFVDDTLVGTYSTSSTPAIISNVTRSIALAGNILYVGTNGSGISVIDTNGTATLSDDTDLGVYSTSSSPAISNNTVKAVSVAGNTVYVSTDSGADVIDTNATSTLSDDSLVGTYSISSSPAISTNFVNSTLLSGTVLYVATQGGADVIDTNGTQTLADDTFLTNYSAGYGYGMAYRAGDILYLVSPGGGLKVVNTQGTVSVGDDVDVTTYNSFSFPVQIPDSLRSMYVHGNLLYVASTSSGLWVIDTMGTVTASDDSVLEHYHTGSSPALPSDFIYGNLAFNAATNLLYIPGGAGNTVFELDPLPSSALSASDTITTALPINGTISITAPADVTMGAITGTGQSALTTNSATWNVKTNNASGYSLAWQASAAPMINLTADTIAGYTPTTANTPEAWSVASTDSEWGAHLASTSDIVDTGIWGTGDTYGTGNWLNVDNTAPYTIASSSTSTTITGDDETVIFGGEIGASKIQPTGGYSVDVTMTATTL